MTWLEDKKKRDEEEARRAEAERDAARAQKEQEQQERDLRLLRQKSDSWLRTVLSQYKISRILSQKSTP